MKFFDYFNFPNLLCLLGQFILFSGTTLMGLAGSVLGAIVSVLMGIATIYISQHINDDL